MDKKLKKKQSLNNLCKNKELRLNLVLSTIVWSTMTVEFYVISYLTKYFPGNIYENTFSLIFADIAGSFTLVYLINKTNLAKTIIITQAISLFGGISSMIFH